MTPFRLTLPTYLLLTANAWAYQPLVTDDTGTQGAGGNQLEFAWMHASEKTAGISTRTDSLPMVYTRGLSETLDVAFGLPWVSSNASGHTESGTGGLSIAAKWRFYEEEKGWSLALKPQVDFAVSANKEANGLGNHGTTYGATLIATTETGFGEFHINAGLSHFNGKGGNTDENSRFISVAPVFKVTDNTKVALDLGLDRTAGDTSYFILLGLVHSPRDTLDLAAGLQKTFSVAGSDNVWTGIVGVTWRFK